MKARAILKTMAKQGLCWKWTIHFGVQERELTVKLKADGDKLTGHFVSPDGQEAAIEDGKYKDGEVSLEVTRERGGNEFGIKFKGKVSGDTIKGESERERDGETRAATGKPSDLNNESVAAHTA